MRISNFQKYEKEYFNTTSEKEGLVFGMYKKFLLDEGLTISGKKICDIGCAKGEWIKNFMNSNECYGYDISEYAITYCKKKFAKKAHFHDLNLNIQSLPVKEKFDIITLFDVIEHLDNFIYLKQIIDINLKTNGYFIVTTPNANSILRFILGNSSYSGEVDATHCMLFTPYTLDFFLRKCGLSKVCLSTPYSFYFKNNFFSKNYLLGGQIFALYKK